VATGQEPGDADIWDNWQSIGRTRRRRRTAAWYAALVRNCPQGQGRRLKDRGLNEN